MSEIVQPDRDKTETREDRVRAWVGELRATLLGLQCKSTVLLAGVMMTVVFVLTGFSIRQTWTLTNRLDRERVLQDAKMLSELAAKCIAHDELDGLRQTVSDLVTDDALWFVSIVDERGAVLARADRTGGQADVLSGSLIGVPKACTLSDGRRSLNVVYPIRQWTEDRTSGGGATIGHVRIGLNRERTAAEFDAAADLVIGIGVAVLLAMIPLGFWVVRRIVEPIDEMSRVTRRFSAGEMTARCALSRSDEIGVLARNLNLMADEVQRKHQEITALNAGLEQRVRERTHQLQELASRDPLTGLYNRRHIGEYLARRMAEALRYGSDLSLMMIDMDDFKAVNDAYGHQVGDKLLTLAALAISSQLRSADVAGRFGGDEFIVLLPHSSGGQARALAERIVARFESELRDSLPRLSVGMSIGIADLIGSGATQGDEFVQAADAALYEAKAAGKHRVAGGGAAVMQ